jgi:hypothetical protein
MDNLNPKEIPANILELLDKCNCSNLLKKHLTLVYRTSIDLIRELTLTFPDLKLIREEIVFGAATHDIGKSVQMNELHEKGNAHELEGYRLLLKMGISENMARFAKTHSDWEDESLKIEDLIVTLADKTWKGVRIHELEEIVSKKICTESGGEFWDVFMKLDEILSKLVIGSDQRINWQNL